jgi:hypothetical protein
MAHDPAFCGHPAFAMRALSTRLSVGTAPPIDRVLKSRLRAAAL